MHFEILISSVPARDISVAWIPFVTMGLEAEKWKIGIDQNSYEVESTAGSDVKEGE